MYSRDLKLIKKFYIVTELDILTSNYFKHKNIAVIINFKNQPDSSIIRKIVKKNIYNKIFISNNTKLITNKKIQGIYLSSYNNKIFLSNKNHVLVSIPPLIWNGFCSMNDDIAILANCSDIPHDKREIKRLPYNDPVFPYKWII